MQHNVSYFHFLLHSADLIEDQLRQRLAKLNVTPRQARVIDALDRMGTASQADLAREFNLTAASLSTMSVRLLEAGYIVRTPHPDEARSNVLRLSDKGRDLLTDIRASWLEIDQLIAEKIGTEQAVHLGGLTRYLRDSLGGRVPGRQKNTAEF
jgi:DNA-binding MarR family transcriptional regulator